MTRVVWSPIGEITDETLVILDASRRVYATGSVEGVVHLVQARHEDGTLICTCRELACRGIATALAFEQGQVAPYFDSPIGAGGEAIAAERG